PEGKALPGTGPEEGQKDDSSKEKDPPPAEEKEVTVTVKTITGATADEGLYDQVAGYNKPHKIKVAKDLVDGSEELAAKLLEELPKEIQKDSDAGAAKGCMLYKDKDGKIPLTKKNTDELKEGGTVSFGKRNSEVAVTPKITVQTIKYKANASEVEVGNKKYVKVDVSELRAGMTFGEYKGTECANGNLKKYLEKLLDTIIDINNIDTTNGTTKDKYVIFDTETPAALPNAIIKPADLSAFQEKTIYLGKCIN
ncbi:MAG: hypothetical protein ACTTI3_07315, partial [Treponema sp.]